MATSAPIPPAIRAAATWAWAGKPAAALFDDELTVVVGSAVLDVPVELVLVVSVVLVVGVVVVVGVVKVVVGIGAVGIVGVVKVVGVKVVVGLRESTKEELVEKVRKLDETPKSVGEDNTVLVATPYGEGHQGTGLVEIKTRLPGSPVSQPLVAERKSQLRTNVRG